MLGFLARPVDPDILRKEEIIFLVKFLREILGSFSTWLRPTDKSLCISLMSYPSYLHDLHPLSRIDNKVAQTRKSSKIFCAKLKIAYFLQEYVLEENKPDIQQSEGLS